MTYVKAGTCHLCEKKSKSYECLCSTRVPCRLSGMKGEGSRCAASCYDRSKDREGIMKWVTPAYCELRLGFEVTAYAYNR